MRVYLDNAATTPLDPEVLEAMLPYFVDFFGNPSSVHSHGRQARAAIEKARKTIAEILNCSPGEIVFTSGGTEADNMAIRGAVTKHKVQRIITSPIEHHAVLHTAEELAHSGIELILLSPNLKGQIELAELEHHLKSTSKKTLVSLMHGNNELGTVLDIEAIGNLCKEYQALFHSDTVQSMSYFPLSAKLPVDFMVASAHKFCGPKGVGFLYRKEAVAVPPLITGGGQERNQRAGTENITGIIGMAFAFEKAHHTMESKTNYIQNLKSIFRKKLKELHPAICFNGPDETDVSLPGIINVSFPMLDTDSMLLFQLDLHQISASGGSACSSGSIQGSHVLKGIGCPPERSTTAIRFSFGSQNTVEEIDYVIEKLRLILQL
ncbi:MAG: cysteine desulfurase [Bacteroidia bacterium]|nr:cysteine desulfurase [Bacteroidia bacterium]